MKKTLTIITAIALFGCGAAPQPEAAQEVAPKAEQQPKMECGSVQAYVLSKNLVLQCVHSPGDVVFPSYSAEFVNTDHMGHFAVMGYFYRNGSKVLYKAALKCAADEWDVAWVNINGVPAAQGMNL